MYSRFTGILQCPHMRALSAEGAAAPMPEHEAVRAIRVDDYTSKPDVCACTAHSRPAIDSHSTGHTHAKPMSASIMHEV